MKKIHVPQEENSTLDGIRKVMYAPDDKGNFQKVNYGSEVEEYATKLAVIEYEELMEKAKQEIRENIASPIAFYMYKNRMDIPTLASVVGMFQFNVKRHLKASIFQKLSEKNLQKYANAFQIELEALKGFKV